MVTATDHQTDLTWSKKCSVLLCSCSRRFHAHCDGCLFILISWRFKDVCVGFSWLKQTLLSPPPNLRIAVCRPPCGALMGCGRNLWVLILHHCIELSPHSPAAKVERPLWLPDCAATFFSESGGCWSLQQRDHWILAFENQAEECFCLPSLSPQPCPFLSISRH